MYKIKTYERLCETGLWGIMPPELCIWLQVTYRSWLSLFSDEKREVERSFTDELWRPYKHLTSRVQMLGLEREKYYFQRELSCAFLLLLDIASVWLRRKSTIISCCCHLVYWLSLRHITSSWYHQVRVQCQNICRWEARLSSGGEVSVAICSSYSRLLSAFSLFAISYSSHPVIGVGWVAAAPGPSGCLRVRFIFHRLPTRPHSLRCVDPCLLFFYFKYS